MRIAIIGAGFGGMAAAFDLRKAGHEVIIYESANYVGGLASGFREPHWDWSVEKFYHHWFQSDNHMLGLIKELGWEDKVIFPRPLTVMYHRGKFYPFDSILRALLFPGLGFGLDKIRFGFVGLFLRLTNNWKALEKVTADSWMTKWAGKNVYEKMWKPLLVGKFGPFYQDVNMAWMWARIKARTTRLGTFEGGFQRFADMFAERLRALGVEIRLGAKVESIKRQENQLAVRADGEAPLFDKVLVTTSPNLMAKLAPDLPENYLKGLLELKSMGAVVMVLALDEHGPIAGMAAALGGTLQMLLGAAMIVVASVFFDGTVRGSVRATCARCLNEYDLPLDDRFSIVLTPRAADVAKARLTPDDLALSTYEGDEIDLAPLVHEQAILALPTIPLCTEGCRGLCPRCGADLNAGPCGCPPPAPDPRLQPLRALSRGT